MADKLRHLLRDAAQRLDVPPPPIDAILADGRRRRGRGNRTRGALAIAASVVLVAGGLVGVSRLVAADRQGQTVDPAGQTSRPGTESNSTEGPFEVSGSGVGAHPFGTDAEDVLAAAVARFGEPEITVGPQRYIRLPGSDAWFEDADDAISPSWRYPVAYVTCWGVLCLVFGGDETDALQLRGWELAQHRRWSEFEQMEDLQRPDVRLAGSGIGLGDSWEKLHAAYPRTVVGGAEGATVAVQRTPWAGVFDGVAGWRLSGQWDSARPTRAPDDAVVTRLSGGEGPEPGCC